MQKKRFGNKSLDREIKIFFSLLTLLLIGLVYVFVGVQSSNTSFESRTQAEGTTEPIKLAQDIDVKDVPKNLNAQEIVITKKSPPENNVTDNRRPLIFVEFRPSVELDKQKTVLKINGQSVNYETYTNSISYQPRENLSDNKIKVEVVLVSKEGAQTKASWSFNLPTTANPRADTTKPTVTNKVLGLPKWIGLTILAIIIIGLSLLILYFIVKLIKTIREERQGNLEAEFTDYYDITKPPYQPQAQVQTPSAISPEMSQYIMPTQPVLSPTLPQLPAIGNANTTGLVPGSQIQPDNILENQDAINAAQTPIQKIKDPLLEEMKKKYSFENSEQSSNQNSSQINLSQD